ncbi:MAG: hypothetical protein J6A85_02255 [Clostridia bacterium]|nr:hypothetical protein [Clostridia bacterium]
MKSNKLHIILTVFLAAAVIVLASILFLRGRENETDVSRGDASVNTEVSKEKSNAGTSTGEISKEVFEEVSVPETSIPAEESEYSNDNTGNDSNPETENSSQDKPAPEESATPDNTQEDGGFTSEERSAGNALAMSFINSYFSEHKTKAPEGGTVSFSGNDILDFYNEAYLLAYDIYHDQCVSYIAEIIGLDGIVKYKDIGSGTILVEAESYHRLKGDGEDVLRAICDYYLAHYTHSIAYELIPKDWVLHNGKLYDYSFPAMGFGRSRYEEHYTVTESENGYIIQVEFTIPEGHYFYGDSMCCEYPYNGTKNLELSPGHHTFTYSLVKENGIWVFDDYIAHVMENHEDPNYWEFTYQSTDY